MSLSALSILLASLTAHSPLPSEAAAPKAALEPALVETRTVNLTQTVTLNDIPAGAKQVQMWVPIPTDTTWQRVLDCEVVSAPGTWKLVRQAEGRGDFVHVTIANPPADTKAASVVVKCVVHREGVSFPLDKFEPDQGIQNELFTAELDQASPLMESTSRVKELADKACGDERDPAKQALMLMKALADNADHYSKDPSKPKCGRGSAEDCMDHGGGCCTDLHSLFIAMARSRGIPARIQYGYRLLDAKAGAAYDPGYRCWAEFFVPGAGWIPTDVVAADNAEAANPLRWASLSATRVWLWSGRSFELSPSAKAGSIDTMICGWAEIDGKAVDPLPSPDGKIPSKLVRTVQFETLDADRTEGAKLPE